MRASIAALIVFAASGCGGGGDDRVALYLKQHLGSDGPRGQIAPVLEPVSRSPRAAISSARQVLVQLRQGPTPDERAHGFEPTIDPQTRFTSLHVRDGTATVAVAGTPLDYYAVAAVVLSLTEIDGIERVRLCCLRRHDGTPILLHRRDDFAGGWQGTPCELRRENRCLRDEGG